MDYSKTVEERIRALEQEAARRYPNPDDSAYRLAYQVGSLQGTLRAVARDADRAEQPETMSCTLAQGVSADDAYEVIDGLRAGLHTRYIDQSPEKLDEVDLALKDAYRLVGELADSQPRPVDACDLAKIRAAA